LEKRKENKKVNLSYFKMYKDLKVEREYLQKEYFEEGKF